MFPNGDLVTFRIFFPEFSSVAAEPIELYLALYNTSLQEDTWGDCFGEAILYRSAHEVALSQNRQANAQTTSSGFVTTSSGAGAITQASAGAISASYAQSSTQSLGSDTDTYLSQTQYGQQYLALKRQCLPLAVRAGCQ